MFENPGKSLKNIGGFIFFGGIILSIIGGFWMFKIASEVPDYYRSVSGGYVFVGIIIIVLGCFISYLISIFISAFGELVENSTAIRYFMENKKPYPTSSPDSVTVEEFAYFDDKSSPKN